MRLLRDLFLFGVAGLLGFVVDTSILYMLSEISGLFVGRLISFTAAVIFTWIFNRCVTFNTRSSGLNRKHEFFYYFLLMLVGGSINYGVYAWLITSYDLAFKHPVVGVAAGSAAGMLVNLVSARQILYRKLTKY